MDTRWRKWGQAHFELPIFQRMGLAVCGKDILEIGCGNGYGAHLLNQGAPRSYVGIDLMEEQVQMARRSYPDYPFLVQDATDLSSFGSASKDVVVIFGVLHHIPEWRRGIDEIKNVLRPGGSLFVEEPRGIDVKLFDFFFRWGHPDSDFGVRRMQEYLKSRGFTLERKYWTPLLTIVHARLNSH
jgi:SAM-dependent methyltransferase